MSKRHFSFISGAGMLLILLWHTLILPNYTLGQYEGNASIYNGSTTEIIHTPRQNEQLAVAPALTVRVGFYENPPKIYTDSDGNISGFWPDLVYFVSAEEGWKIEWVPGTWEQGLQRLERSQIDIMPDVAWTKARSEKYAFSTQKVLISWSRLYAQPGSHIETVLDLEGKTIAGLTGSVNYDGPEGIKDITSRFRVGSTFIDMNNYTEVFEALQNKTVDAGVTNKDFGNQNELNYDVERTPFVFQPAHIEFAFPKDGDLTPILLERIDAHVKALKANDNSIYYQSLEKYLERKAAETFVEIIPAWVKNLSLVGGGVILFLLAVGITSRVQVQRQTLELHQSEARYQSIFEQAGVGIIISSTSDQIERVNKGFCQLTGYTPEELEGRKSFLDITHPDDVEPDRKMMKAVLDGNRDLSWEKRYLKKDGSTLWGQLTPTVIYNAQGRPQNLVGIVQDITERKLAETALRKSEELFSKAFHGSPAPMTLIRLTDGTYIEVNESFLRLVECNREEVIGRTNLDLNLINAEGCAKSAPLFHQQGVSHNNEVQVWTKSGRQLIMLVSVEQTELAGEACAITTMLNITERKQAEEAVRRERDLSKAIIDGLPGVFYLYDEQGRFLRWNKNFTQVTGYTDAEMAERHPLDFFSGPDKKLLAE